MPRVDGRYYNPGWADDTAPAIDMVEMNAISDTLESHQTSISNLVTSVGAKIPMSEKGNANGVATLNQNGIVPLGQLPGTAEIVTGTLNANAWTYDVQTGVYSQALTVSSSTSDNIKIVDCVLTGTNTTQDAYILSGWAVITSVSDDTDGRLIFKCYADKPTANIPVEVAVMKVWV